MQNIFIPLEAMIETGQGLFKSWKKAGILMVGAMASPLWLAAQEVIPANVPSPAPPASEAVLPAMPLGVAMTSNSLTSVTLEWYRAANNDAKGYHVYFGNKEDGVFEQVASVTERTFTHEKLAPGTTGYYKISATNDKGESAQSAVAMGFTISPWKPQPFPVQVARNMCVSLGGDVVSNLKPISGVLSNLADGSDATSCRFRKDCEIKIRLNPDISIEGADYLMLNFRTDCGPADWSNDKLARTFKNYVIIESSDSTNGEDGTWKEVASGRNDALDGVLVLPNHKPKWIGIRNTGDPTDEKPEAADKRPLPRDLILARFDVFRSAPAGYRNDYWIFVGDSLIVGDMPAGGAEGRKAWFSDLIRKEHPDRYPMVVHAGRGGERLEGTLSRVTKLLPVLNPPNGTSVPTGTIICWETGFNDVGLGASLALGGRLLEQYKQAGEFCKNNGLIIVPVRIEYSNYSLNPDTLEPLRYNIFYNTLAVNLAGVDVFGRAFAPYACDPETQLPFADYWTYMRKNFAASLNPKDSVHHTTEGADGINLLWAGVADKMIYKPQAASK